jgi:hypothetical protein
LPNKNRIYTKRIHNTKITKLLRQSREKIKQNYFSKAVTHNPKSTSETKIRHWEEDWSKLDCKNSELEKNKISIENCGDEHPGMANIEGVEDFEAGVDYQSVKIMRNYISKTFKNPGLQKLEDKCRIPGSGYMDNSEGNLGGDSEALGVGNNSIVNMENRYQVEGISNDTNIVIFFVIIERALAGIRKSLNLHRPRPRSAASSPRKWIIDNCIELILATAGRTLDLKTRSTGPILRSTYG